MDSSVIIPIVVASIGVIGTLMGVYLKFKLEQKGKLDLSKGEQQVGKNQFYQQIMPSSISVSEIHYGQTIRLIHFATGRALHSHRINYFHEGSSKQQQVTGFAGNDENDHWVVKGPHGFDESYKKGETVKNRDIIRFEHKATKTNLHSHGDIPSPLTKQQEVTAFGINGIGDNNDNWQLRIDSPAWIEGKKLKLIHAATNKALHSHIGYEDDHLTSGQQEVTAFPEGDDNDYWIASLVDN